MDLSKLSTEQLMGLLSGLEAQAKEEKQAKALERARGEERQKMMDERGTLENLAAGFGKSLVDTGRGVGQLLGIVPQETIDEAKRLDAPLMESGGGIVGNVAGQVAQSMAPLGAARLAMAGPARLAGAVGALPGANTILGGAALGGVQSGIQPVATGESRGANTALGVVAGGAIPAAVGAYRAGKAALVDPITQAGRDRIAGRMLNDFAADPQGALAKLQGAQSAIPGVRPMVSEATLDPGLATLERSMHNFPGPMQEALRQRLSANNAARQQFLEALGGTPDMVDAAKAARSAAFETAKKGLQGIEADVPTSRTINLIDRILASPNAENDLLRGTLTNLRGKFFEPYPAGERLSEASRMIREAVDRAHKRNLNAGDVQALETARRAIVGASRKLGDTDPAKHGALVADALDKVYEVTSTTKGAQGAIQDVVNLLGSSDVAYKRDPARLMEIYKEINRVRSGLKADGADITTLKSLDAIKRSLANAIDRATSDQAKKVGVQTFKEANREYSKASTDIDAMRIIQSVKSRASGNRPDVSVTPGGMIDVGEAPLAANQFLGLVRPDRQKATVQAVTREARPGAFERYLSQGQMRGISDLADDVARTSAAAERGKAQGSPTAQFLYAQNLLRQSLGPIGLPVSWADKAIRGVSTAPVVGAAMAGANRLAGRGLAEHVADVMGDPRRAAALMSAANRQQMALLNPGVARFLPPTLAGIATGMFGAPRQLPQEEPPYGARW